jgi:hypothetical protein
LSRDLEVTMPYRGEPVIDVCARHPAAQAYGSCGVCGVRLCECCLLFDGARACCRDCSASERRKRRAWRIGFGAASALALVASVVLVRQGVAQARADAKTRLLEHQVTVLSATVDDNRCDVRANVELVALLSERGTAAEAQQRIDDYCYQCAHLGERVPWSCAPLE